MTHMFSFVGLLFLLGRDKRHILIVEIKQKCVRCAIACEIEQQQIQCDIKLKLLAAVKWGSVRCRAGGAAAAGAVLLGGFPFSDSALPLHMN